MLDVKVVVAKGPGKISLETIQIGIRHEHVLGEIASLKKPDDLFEPVGHVDERSFCKTPFKPGSGTGYYKGYRKLTPDEALNFPGLKPLQWKSPTTMTTANYITWRKN